MGRCFVGGIVPIQISLLLRIGNLTSRTTVPKLCPLCRKNPWVAQRRAGRPARAPKPTVSQLDKFSNNVVAEFSVTCFANECACPSLGVWLQSVDDCMGSPTCIRCPECQRQANVNSARSRVFSSASLAATDPLATVRAFLATLVDVAGRACRLSAGTAFHSGTRPLAQVPHLRAEESLKSQAV